MKELASDEDILVLPTDKGMAMVVMDRTDYDQKMQKMLSEESMYQPVEKSPTSSLETKIYAQLMNLKQSGRHSNNLSHYRMGYSRYTNRLSPIVSFVASPAYQLSKFLSGVLVVGQISSYVKNSKSFAEFIATQTLTKEEILISFDVLSLFTCIPTGLAVQVAFRG